MKIEFIRRGAATRLILIFAGWSTDCNFYRDCTVDGWDTAVVGDYRDLSMPDIPEQYKTIYVFAYSLGVWAAAASHIEAAAKIAIFGTPSPVSDVFGIPESVFHGTAEGLNDRNLLKFHMRMAGGKSAYEYMAGKLPPFNDIPALREELLAIANFSKQAGNEEYKWHRAYIAKNDLIIPATNQRNYWETQPTTDIVEMDSPHAADMACIIRTCINSTDSIRKGFSNASDTYRENAMVQSEVCHRVGGILSEKFGPKPSEINSLLELGPGKGLLTDEWSKHLRVSEATYVDLTETGRFAKAPAERYITADAESWMGSTDETFDVILSASVIQWFADPIRFIRELDRHLNPGGMAIITTYVRGNLRELDHFRPSPIIYRSEEEYHSACHMESERWTRTISFDSPREALMHLKRTGVKPMGKENRLTGVRPLKLSEVSKNLTYEPMIIKITKPNETRR